MANTDDLRDVRTSVSSGQADDALAQAAMLVRGDYQEMPGLSLTFRQAMRLWHLDAASCRLVLDLLVGTGFLTETRHGAYRRLQG